MFDYFVDVANQFLAEFINFHRLNQLLDGLGSEVVNRDFGDIASFNGVLIDFDDMLEMANFLLEENFLLHINL